MVVVRAAPFTCTIEPLTNPVPLTVSVNPGLPAVTLDGLIEVMVGTPCARAAVPEITGNKISTGSKEPKQQDPSANSLESESRECTHASSFREAGEPFQRGNATLTCGGRQDTVGISEKSREKWGCPSPKCYPRSNHVCGEALRHEGKLR